MLKISETKTSRVYLMVQMVATYSSSTSLYNSSSTIVSTNSNSTSNSDPTKTASDHLLRPLIAFFGVKNILKNQSLNAHAMNATQGNVTSPRSIIHINEKPDHLLVLVHGIMGSQSDWTYVEAQMKRQLGRNFLIYGHASGEEHKEPQKDIFSSPFPGRSFARYAAAVLYTPGVLADQCDNVSGSTYVNSKKSKYPNKDLIAGLEPIHFITLATPHLGVRGKKQLPFLLGLSFLENLAAPIAPFIVGLTGSQLFLTDGKEDKPPLLLQMASDCEDGNFISALGSFRQRIIYANVAYDHLVGWGTSSIRRESEHVKPPLMSLDGYKHIVAVKHCPPVLSEGPSHTEAAKAKEVVQNAPNTHNTIDDRDIMEEEMIHGLHQLGWTTVDVSFHSAPWAFFAHYIIHVRNERLHNAGAEVVDHVAEQINQHEKQCEGAWSY